MEYNTQGLGFLVGAFFIYMAYKKRNIKWLMPVGISLFAIMFYMPFKTTVPSIDSIEAFEKPEIVVPEKVEIKQLTLEEEQNKLVEKVND